MGMPPGHRGGRTAGAAAGVLFSQGSRFGGHSLYVKDGRLVYAYSFIGESVQVVQSDQAVPTGHVVLSAS
jgi:hypothetical protein